MDDMIKRQDAIDAVTKYCVKYDLRDLLADIEVLPSAQKTGKWIREVLGSTSGYGTTVMYQCTNCEKMSINKYKFCPNCGARMEVEE